MPEDALLSRSLDLELMTDEADIEVVDKLLENKTLWGRCFIRATKLLARCRARLRLLLSCGRLASASPPAPVALPLTPPSDLSLLLPSLSNPSTLDGLRPSLCPPSTGDCFVRVLGGSDGDLEDGIHERLA